MQEYRFEALGNRIDKPRRKLEVFPKPEGIETVTMDTEEVTSLCPVTGQPDFSTVVLEYKPRDYCLESKSLKLYLWSFRDEGLFCESLASRVAKDVMEALRPYWCRVTVIQRPRGGIRITATAFMEHQE